MEAKKDKPSNPCYLVHFRHGERADDAGRTDFPIAHDPPLTELGMKQARLTGEFIKNHLGEEMLAASTIHVASSPFLRCLQTSAGVLKGAGIEDTPITVHNNLSEYLNTNWFPEGHPIGSITIDKASPEELKTDLEAASLGQKIVLAKPTEEETPPFPENLE